jgi:hypothetical protein
MIERHIFDQAIVAVEARVVDDDIDSTTEKVCCSADGAGLCFCGSDAGLRVALKPDCVRQERSTLWVAANVQPDTREFASNGSASLRIISF